MGKVRGYSKSRSFKTYIIIQVIMLIMNSTENQEITEKIVTTIITRDLGWHARPHHLPTLERGTWRRPKRTDCHGWERSTHHNHSQLADILNSKYFQDSIGSRYHHNSTEHYIINALSFQVLQKEESSHTNQFAKCSKCSYLDEQPSLQCWLSYFEGNHLYDLLYLSSSLLQSIWTERFNI